MGKAWRDANKEKIKAYNKWYRETIYKPQKREQEQTRKYNLKVNFGITPEEYDALLDKQEGNCRICGRHQTEFTRRLAVDHCHSTGGIRGLLCSHCNIMLGHARDKIEVLENAIQYLKDFNNA